MKLLQIQHCISQVNVSLVYHLVVLDLEVDAGLHLHVDDEVDASHDHEGKKDSEHYVQIQLQNTRTPLGEEQAFGVTED